MTRRGAPHGPTGGVDGTSVTRRLESLRKALPGCSAVVLGDMSSELVLRASLSDDRPQEWLDALCAAGAALLTGPLAERAGDGPAGQGVTWAAASSREGIRLFVRLPGDEADVLCCVCVANVDISGATRQAGAALAAIAGQG